MAGFWGGLPDLPLTWLRRNLDLALEYSCRAISGDRHCLESSNGTDECDRFLENRLTFVKYYLLPSGHIEDAVRILREIATDPSSDSLYPLHNPLARHDAETLLDSIGEEVSNEPAPAP